MLLLHRIAACFLFLVTPAITVDAQSAVTFVDAFTFHGDSADDLLGFSVSGAGDVNGDGFIDFVAGAMGSHIDGSYSGLALVYSGSNGSVLHRVNGVPGKRLGYSVSGVGDLNSDGFDDLIIGSREILGGDTPGFARVVSGADGSNLFTLNGTNNGDNFGVSVSGTGDLNGDGINDLIVGSDRNLGSVQVRSGADGATLYTFTGDSLGDQFGSSVSDAGDVNGDGISDLIVGAFGDDNNGSFSGSARVLSGQDGAVLHDFSGDSAGDQLGNSVSGAGDVNGDGFDDLIVGALGDDNNGVDSGTARVFSGLDGSVLHTFSGVTAGDFFGRSVSSAGDVDGDGFDDVIVGSDFDSGNGLNSGTAFLYSGNDGMLLHTFIGDQSGDRFGISIDNLGDINGDGVSDFVVGAAFGGLNDGGYARVFVSQVTAVPEPGFGLLALAVFGLTQRRRKRSKCRLA